MKDKIIKCVSSIPYSKEELRDLKKAGYKVINVEDDKEDT
jgi:predicted fused transcriptional regulator/phosphomethylpyrimidine kinase